MKQYLTPEKLKELEKELNFLKTKKRKEIVERLKEAASFGDLSENAAYDEAKEAQAFLEGKILELENLIKNAIVIEKKSNNKVQIGSEVEVLVKGKKEKFKIVSSLEANPLEGKISASSPLGRALLNRKRNETFVVETPEEKVKYKILKIKN
jgi:transcription elongation factor GreA